MSAHQSEPGPLSLQRNEESFRLLVDSVRDYAIFMLTADGRVLTWNAGAEQLKGWRADEIIGRSFETFYEQDAIDSGWPAEELRRATADGRFEDQGWRVRKDGSRFWANVVITALRAESGELRGFAKVTRDLTDARRQEEALRQSEEQFRLLVQSVTDSAIFLIDPAGFILTWNIGAESIHGYAAAEVVGKHFSILFTEADVQAGLPAREMDRALREGRAQDQGCRLRKDGSSFFAEVVLSPVRNTQDQLRGFAQVTRDLTEQRRLLEAEQGSRRMREFLAMLAHELRNPMAPIRNAVNLMQRQVDLPAPLRRSSEIIERQIRHMARLVDDLLDVGRIVTGKILLKQQPIDFREVVRASVESVQPQMDAAMHRLDLSLPGAPLPMMADATRLVQALQNLLGNAARYTPPGGHIKLDVSVDGDAVVATVTDSGIGIEADALERIFDLFVQEKTDRAPQDQGLGIGLTLARTLVLQHGGTLSAHSDGIGRGSRFTVRLPLQRPAADPSGGPAASTAQAGRPDAPGMPRRRILVVDDNKDSADTMAELLRVLGYEALVAYGGSEALGVADRFLPEIVLLDLNMPVVGGYEVLKSLREQPAFSRLFIAAMTGYGQQFDRQSTLAAGFDDHLTKPVPIEQLQQTLARAAPLESA
jgi:PAS domain S-box-containing protein